MRKIYLAALLLCLAHSLGLSAQKRIVLIEEFTNTGCGPCASWSPDLDSCIRYRLGDVVAIKFHAGYPERTDRFYLESQDVDDARLSLYGVSGVPATFVNGTELAVRSFAFLNQAISYCLEQPQPVNIGVSKSVSGDDLKIDVTISPTADVEAADLRLHVAAIEEHIDLNCSNGETELNYTMRRMPTGPDGLELGTELQAGTTLEHHFETTIDNFYNKDLLGVVAFVQNMDTHEVLATAYTGPGADGDNRLALANLYDTPDLICTPAYYGKVIMRNDGANAITSATLNLTVNGQTTQYPWTGHLNYLDRDTLSFGPFTGFSLNESGRNDVKVWFTDVNGTTAESNARQSAFSHSIRANYDVRLKIYTDKKPEEITWKLFDSAGDVVREGGPYTEARKFVTVDLGLTRDDCYQLEFYDAGGDGIKGDYGNGYYQLFQLNAEGKATRIDQGDYDGAMHVVNFHLSDTPQPERRLVLFEEFTNTSCDPCAEFSPSLDKTIYSRMGEMVCITYHWNFPSRTDPFYLANPDDALARANVYGVTGVPSLRVLGEHVGAWGYEEYLDGYVDGAALVPATVNLDTEASLTDDGVKVGVSLSPIGITDGSKLRLFVAAVEERIEWDKPAANGERAWNYVMRKLLPSADGQPLEAELTKVTPYQYEYTWTVDNLTDPTELGIVTFVQDMETLAILGTTYTPRPTGSRSAAKILQTLNMPDRICTPLFTADVVVRNTGRDALTSAVVNVSINGQVQQTDWTGRLDYLAIDTLRTPAFTDFQLADGNVNDVEIWLSQLNGTQEESVHKTYTLTNAYQAHGAVRLTIMTDKKPEETTWAVMNSAGDVVCQGGPYTEARKKVVVDLPLTADDCYLLEFEDAGGDGITGDNGRGYYMLHEVGADGKTRLLVQDTYTEALHDVNFSLQNAVTNAVKSVALPTQQSPVYDLQGRPVADPQGGVYVRGNKKIIIK